MTKRRVQIFWKPLKAFWCGGVQPAVIAAAEWNCVNLTGRDILPSTARWTCLMLTPVPPPPPRFDDLSVDEDIDYGQSSWDRIAASPDSIPVPDWYREILDER